MTHLIKLSAAALLVSAFAFAPSSAFAAHCVAPADEPSSPGFSYFGNDHVQEANHPEGTAEHGGNGPGASECRHDTGSPSERAPGKK